MIEGTTEKEISRDQVLELVGGTLMSAMNAAAGATVSGPKG